MNQYPLWRYILMVVVIVFGVLYALPVIYGEDPAIQITSKNAVTLPANMTTQISDGLKNQNIPYLSIKQQAPTTLLIRFLSTEGQLKAQDIIQAVIGKGYTVALNLAPRTPKWLQAIGAKPMKLGLDLRGGIHFLLQVDLSDVLKKRLSSDLNQISTQLRDKQIRYAGINSNVKTNTISLRFRNKDAQESARSDLSRNFPSYIFQASNNGLKLSATLSTAAAIKIGQDAVSQTLTILRNRVNELGVAEPVIVQQGKNQISVDLPGIQDMARAKDMIGKVATVRLQMVDTEHDAAQAAQSGIVPFGTTLFKYQGQPYLLKNRVVLHGSSILNASTIVDENGRPAVSVRVGGSGVTLFNKVTGANIGKPMATVFTETQATKKIVNGKLTISQKQVTKIINIATIQNALGNSFQITGLESMQYAKDLALLLRSGAYVAPVVFVGENLVGPSLGKDNIRKGVLSCEVGSLLVIIFMAFYYRLFGLVADFALIANVVILIALMAMLGFTLTLPGIAGIVLTVGMAVDANVLINERIREELRNGMSPQGAIHAGYGRAFTTIVDANVTTLIVALVLYALGTGPVQGFAVTIALGLLISMMTAIFFTRAIINLIYGRRQVKHLSIGIKVKDKNANPAAAKA